MKRSRERADFWLWLLRYRRQSRPFLMEAIARHASHAVLHVIPNPEALRLFVADVRRNRKATEPPADILSAQSTLGTFPGLGIATYARTGNRAMLFRKRFLHR